MEIVKLAPAVKVPVWSGNKIEKWNKPGCEGKIGETWELSFLESGPSTVDGVPVSELFTRADWGRACESFDKFPVLIKFIDAAQDLSVQVHPDEAYAEKNGLIAGKTECWYVVEADKGAYLYLGFNRKTSRSEVERAAKDGSIVSLLNRIPVKKGDCFFVESGTVHAIGAGVTVAEVQQSSDVTFRVFDYNRLGTDGKPRELHLDRALDVMSYERYEKRAAYQMDGSLHTTAETTLLATCEYFTMYSATGVGKMVSHSSFLAITFVDGEGEINGQAAKKGDTFFAPCGTAVSVKGDATYLISGVGI
jgi:mannose-6-phosphate isomerase